MKTALIKRGDYLIDTIRIWMRPENGAIEAKCADCLNPVSTNCFIALKRNNRIYAFCSNCVPCSLQALAERNSSKRYLMCPSTDFKLRENQFIEFCKNRRALISQ